MNFIKSLLLLFYIQIFAQDTTKLDKPKIDFSGYIDTYYFYDFQADNNSSKQPFLYNYNKQNEFNVNIALLRASIAYKNLYGKLSLHAGTYVDANYAAENLKNINEAYIGLYFNDSQKTNIEVGILPSYIGFETATSHSNLTATRSLLAESSPYFMTGVKLNHQFTSKFSGAFLVTNGWQRIQKAKTNLPPTFGTQLVYKPTDKDVINWSTFVGKEYNGFDFNQRYFSNLYWDRNWGSKFHTILGFDYGVQDTPNVVNKQYTWYSPVGIMQYTINDKWQMAYRAEYFHDPNNVIIAVGQPFKTIGNSLNFDYKPYSFCKIRTEGKLYSATENLFDSNTKKDNFSITTTMSFEF